MKKAVPKLKLGIVSGIGPLAGAYVHDRVVQQAATEYGALEDVEYPDVVLISHGIKGVGKEAGLSDVFKNDIKHSVSQLESLGAQCIGIACNTAHVYLKDIQASAKAKIIDLIEEVAKEAAKNKEKYLLLTSRSSKEQQLHVPQLKKHNVAFSLSTEEQQEKLDEIIELVMAFKLHEAAELLDDVLAEAAEQGYTGIIAGCTEIPLALRYSKAQEDFVILDSNLILAKALTRECYA